MCGFIRKNLPAQQLSENGPLVPIGLGWSPRGYRIVTVCDPRPSHHLNRKRHPLTILRHTTTGCKRKALAAVSDVGRRRCRRTQPTADPENRRDSRRGISNSAGGIMNKGRSAAGHDLLPAGPGCQRGGEHRDRRRCVVEMEEAAFRFRQRHSSAPSRITPTDLLIGFCGS
jgi:hypothetical protein